VGITLAALVSWAASIQRAPAQPGEPLDFGDAPDGTLAPRYPTLLVNNGARHFPSQLYLGGAVDFEPDGQPTAGADGDDLNPPMLPDDEDGVVFNTAFISGVPGTLTVISSGPGWLQGWVDFNADGDWADPGEQIIADYAVVAGVNVVPYAAPFFQVGSTSVVTYARFRLASQRGLGFAGPASDGEVEDYLVKLSPLKWLQPPDLTPNGVDVNGEFVLADDFQCTQSGPITDIHIWGSFLHDYEGLPPQALSNLTFILTIYSDLPAGDPRNPFPYSIPDEALWRVNIGPGQYGVGRTAAIPPPGEWWHTPPNNEWIPGADQFCYQFDFYFDRTNAFRQVKDTVYWLSVQCPAADQFLLGWKTTDIEFQWNDDAVWAFQANGPWAELRYGDGHPYGMPPGLSMDLAFALSTEAEEPPATDDFGDAPDAVAAAGYPTLLANDGARHTVVPGVLLGQLIDAERDGQPNATATGDDLNNLQDEDGVTLISLLVPGESATVRVLATVAGNLSAWVDFGADGSWAQAGDQIFTNLALNAGVNNLTFPVPFTAARGTNTFARFRFSTATLTNYTGWAPDGEVEDYQWRLEELDFGDAPEPTFPTTYANNGARHILVPTIFLGPLIDSEVDGQPNASATGDDLARLADEDGVVLLTPLLPGQRASVQVTATMLGGLANAPLNAWIDFGADGSWAQPGDQICNNVNLTPGVNVVTFPVPPTAAAGSKVIARFRFSTMPGLSFTGLAPNGEVEDYQWEISQLDFGDAPDPTFPTWQTNNGACHVIGPLFLGGGVDAEHDGQPDATATGDDLNGADDEDGVFFPAALIANAPAVLPVVSSGAGLLQGWFDFNGDGNWTGANEQPIVNRPVVAGTNLIQIFVPNAVAGQTYARFRLSSLAGLSFTNQAPDGEVEDYALTFQSLKWNQPPEQGPEGVDVYAGRPLADDFLCRQSGPITDIHIWGSFLNDVLPAGGPGHMNITLKIYRDVPAGPNGYSQPGEVLWSRTFAPGQFTAGLAMLNASEWWHDPSRQPPLWMPNADTNIWQFDFYIHPADAFVQVADTVYWLGVQYEPTPDDPDYQFGWKTTYLQWNDAACWFDPVSGTWLPLLYGDGHPRAQAPPPMNQMDFAFALSTAEVDWGDAPDPTYPTLAANNGAGHVLVPGLKLGSLIDAEGDGQPNATATGDDNANLADEDGVLLPLLVPGQVASATVTVTGSGRLNAWIDFAADGSWAQPGDQVFTNVPLATGTHVLNFLVPSNAPWGATTFARFRFSTAANLSPTGLAPDGEVEDYLVNLHPLPPHDLGDAPDSSNNGGPIMTAYPKGGPPGTPANYPTVYGGPALVPVGPIHLNPQAAAFLGNAVSGEFEADILPDQDFVNNIVPATDTPDQDGADDGLVGPVHLPHCRPGTFQVRFSWPPGPVVPMFLNVWCDWNRDGDWNDVLTCPDGTLAPEWAAQNIPVPQGVPVMPVPVTAWHPSLTKTPLWIRITLAEQPWPPPGGGVAGGDGPALGYQFGETEDYYLTDYEEEQTFDFGDAPAPYPTLLPGGARHLLVSNFLLGHQIDAEADGLPDPLARGDDTNNLPDEDGVAFTTPLLAGTQACVTVRLVGPIGGRLDAWVDFNRNGVWDAAEQVFAGQPLLNGVNPGLCFPVPTNAVLGTNFARFRLSSVGGLPPTGAAQDGEVEDYQVIIRQRAPQTNIVITNITVLNLTAPTQVVTIQWNAEVGLRYLVLGATNLGTNNGTDIVWQVLSPEIIGPNHSYSETNTALHQRYYRVRTPYTWP